MGRRLGPDVMAVQHSFERFASDDGVHRVARASALCARACKMTQKGLQRAIVVEQSLAEAQFRLVQTERTRVFGSRKIESSGRHSGSILSQPLLAASPRVEEHHVTGSSATP